MKGWCFGHGCGRCGFGLLRVRLRARARDQGWSLSEKGFIRIGEDGEPLTGDAAELRTFATEAEVYEFLDLPFIEPELREDAGEIEAALAGRLPTLITLADLQGDLHSHSDWSDGVHAIEVMAETARQRGHAYQLLTDQPGVFTSKPPIGETPRTSPTTPRVAAFAALSSVGSAGT